MVPPHRVMRPGFVAAAALAALGAAAGALQRPAAAYPRRADAGDMVLAADFHVHAAPGDGALTPPRLLDEASLRGLDAIAVTNHNQMIAVRLARWTVGTATYPILLSGAEITNPRYHLIAVGISRPVDWRLPPLAAVQAVHAQGGVAIAAHPAGRYAPGWTDDVVALLDGVEVAHPMRDEGRDLDRAFDEFYARARRLNPDVAAIGSSDYHVSQAIGQCRTYVFARELSAAAILDAIRHGQTVAEAADGRLFGDPELTPRVLAHRGSRRTVPASPLQVLAAGCVWAGVAGMVILRRRLGDERL